METNNILREIDSFFEHNDVQGAERFMHNVLNNAKLSDRHDIIILICNELAGLYRAGGNKSECYSMLSTALKLQEEHNLTDQISYITTLLNQATAFSAFGDTHDALKIYDTVEKYYTSNLDPYDYRIASLYNNMSAAFLKIGYAENGLSYLKKSLNILKSIESTDIEQATCLTNIAQIEMSLSNLTSADIHLQKAQEIYLTMKKLDVHYDAFLAALGNLRFLQENYQESAEYFQLACERVKETFGYNYNYKLLCKNCIKAWEASGNSNKAAFWKEELNKHD